MNRFITASAGLVLAAAPLVATTATTAAASTAGTAGTASTASTAAVQRTAPAYSVTAKINKSVVTIGEDVIKVRGRVSPRAAGDPVVLQQRLDGQKSWKKSGTADIKANGTYVVKDKATVTGSREYRVLKPAADGLAKGTSNIVSVQVFKWELLINRMPGTSQNVDGFNIAYIGTKFYGSSLVVNTPGAPAYIEYTLGRLCASLRTTYALDDRSATGATGSVTLTVDGVTKVAQPLVVGQAVASTTDLTNAFRLRYDLGSQATPVSMPTAASPEVLCTK